MRSSVFLRFSFFVVAMTKLDRNRFVGVRRALAMFAREIMAEGHVIAAMDMGFRMVRYMIALPYGRTATKNAPNDGNGINIDF